jgi:hypothetical protein
MKINGFADAVKNKPKQSQTNSKRSGDPPTGELLGILKPGTNQTQLQTNHPIFQKNLQKTLFPSIFRLFYSSFLLFFFCLFRLMPLPAASAAQSPSATPPAIGATTAATLWAARES